MARLKKERPDFKLLIVGTGELEVGLHSEARDLGLKDDIIWLSNRIDTERLYCAMDCFVLPSTNEGLGIVMIEAQANGLTCLGSTGIPIEAFVCDCARRLPLDDKESWVNALKRIEVGERLPGVIRRLQKAGFSIDDTAAKLERYYLE